MTEASPSIDWAKIEPLARELGVTDEALRKWRVREKVPGKWQVPLVIQSKGKLTFSDVAPEVVA